MRTLRSADPTYLSQAVPSSIDPREIQHFNSSSTVGGSAERARGWLSKYNPVRFEFLARILGCVSNGGELAGRTILDVGCGTGIFCELLAERGASVTGIDPAEQAVAVAQKRAIAHGSRIDYRAQDLNNIHDAFDVVTAMEVIEHVASPTEFLRECALRVKPGGWLVLSTLDRSIKSFVYAKVMGEYVLGMLPRGAHQWTRFVRPSEVENMLMPLRFSNFVRSGVTLNLRSGDLQLSKDCSVNYLLAARLDRPLANSDAAE